MVASGVQLLGATDVRRLAAELDLRPTKQRGQNFVIDANTVRRIVRESGVGPDDVVVEVGPGLGSLTLALLDVARRVVAIEIDDLLSARLAQTAEEFAGPRAAALEVVAADALRVDGVPGPPPTALVANLPYNVSVPVLLHLMTVLPSLQKGLVMVQAEVADRLAAPPGSRTYGVPSVKAAWFAEVRRAGAVGRNVFWPAPNVDSGLVAWTHREPPVTTASREQVFAVVDAAFAQRRKQLRPALSGLAGSAEAAEAALRAAGVDPTDARRGPRRHGVRPDRGVPVLGGPRMTFTVRAPAKINLHLGVGALRDDGFHPLVTVYQAVGLYDDVTVERSPGWTLGVTVPDWIDADAVPVTGDNIVDRAARLLAAHHGVERARLGVDRQGHPGRRRHGRRLRGRRGRAGRARPALGARDVRRRPAGPGRRARERRAVRAPRRHGARHRPRRARRAGRPTRRRGGGSSYPPPRGCRRPRSTGASTS